MRNKTAHSRITSHLHYFDKVYNPLNKLVRRIRMKYVYITSFGIIFTTVVGSIQAVVNPQNWVYLQSISTTTWIGIGFGFVILIGFAIFCLKQVRKIDDIDKETQKQEMKNMILEAFGEAELLKTHQENGIDKKR